MLTCKEIARLVSDGLDTRLSWRQRIGVGFHLMLCTACGRYSRQIAALQTLISEHFRRQGPETLASDQELDDTARNRLNEALRRGRQEK